MKEDGRKFDDQDALLLSIVIAELAREDSPRSRSWILAKLNGSSSYRLITGTSAPAEAPRSIFTRIVDEIQKSVDQEHDLRLRSILQKAVDAELLAEHEEGRAFSVTERGRGWSASAYRRAGDTVDVMQEEILFACLVCMVISSNGAPLSADGLFEKALSDTLLKVREGSRLATVRERLRTSGTAGLERGIAFARGKGWIQALDHRLHLTELGRSEGVHYFD